MPHLPATPSNAPGPAGVGPPATPVRRTGAPCMRLDEVGCAASPDSSLIYPHPDMTVQPRETCCV